MSAIKVLVTGGSGGLGRYVLRAFEARKVEVVAPTHAECNVVLSRDVGRVVSEALPNVVVHLAAVTDTEYCEANPLTAVAVNAIGTANVARWCEKVNANLVYMSTDAVFAGRSEPGPYDESSVPVPYSVYGWTKFAGEQAVAALGSSGLIVRANFFTRFCNGKRSFASHVIDEAKAKNNFGCYCNVQSTPVYASTLAEKIVSEALCCSHGTIHVASRDSVNRVVQASMICEAYGLSRDGIVIDKRRNSVDGRLRTTFPCGMVREEIEKMVREEPL